MMSSKHKYAINATSVKPVVAKAGTAEIWENFKQEPQGKLLDKTRWLQDVSDLT